MTPTTKPTITAAQCRAFAAKLRNIREQVLAAEGPGWMYDEYHLGQAAFHLEEAAESLAVVELALECDVNP